MVGFTREMVELPSEIVGARNEMVGFARETYESGSYEHLGVSMSPWVGWPYA